MKGNKVNTEIVRERETQPTRYTGLEPHKLMVLIVTMIVSECLHE